MFRCLPKSTLTCILLVLSVLLLVPDIESGADIIKLPGSRFNTKRAKDGRPFKSKGWKVTGKASWVERKDSVIKNNFAVSLASKSKISRDVTIAELKVEADTKVGNQLQHWVYLLCADVALRSEGRANGRAEVQLRIEVPGTSRAFSQRLKVTKTGFQQRIVLPISTAKMKSGVWSLSVKSIGAANVLVDDVFCLKVPRDPSVMKFAKPNGKNGPDRLESGTLGFVSHTAHEHGPLPVVSVRKDSPAAAAGLLPGDIILEVNGRALGVNSCKPGFDWFENGHEPALGRASELALATASPRVSLKVLRGEQTKRLAVKLKRRLPLPENFPFDDEVTPQLYEELLDFVRRTRKKQGHWANGGTDWIQTSFAGLALLGRRDPQDYQAIREIADWFMVKFPTPESFGNLGFWSASYAGIFLCEYLLASGDDRVRPWIESALRWIEDGFHTSKWGMPALGHGPSGLPYGQKALMAPASHVVVFEALAKKAGIESTIWPTLLPYMKHSWSDPKEKGHGAMGYNASYRDLGEFWSRSGLFALATQLRGVEKFMRRSLVKIMTERHSFMRNSHAYGNPGDVWGLAGLFCSDAQAFAKVMKAWRWSFGGAWEVGFGLRHTTAHMGSPYMGGEGLLNPAMAMLLSVRHRGLFITGASDQDRLWLKLEEKAPAETRIRMVHDAEGWIHIKTSPPGLPVRYTTHGTKPTSKSLLYEGRFLLHDGGLVIAGIEEAKGVIGSVSKQIFGLPKLGWRVLAATGASKKEDAIRRAGKLIDGDDQNPWQPDRGQDAPGFPFTVTIDLGTSQTFRGLVFRGNHVPENVQVAWGNAPALLAKKVASFTTTKKRPSTVDFGKLVSARYIHIEILSARKGKARFGELELLWPNIVETRERQNIDLGLKEEELTLRYIIGKGVLDDSSKEFRGPIKLKPGQVMFARAFDKRGKLVGPCHVYQGKGTK
ncbi:MAG: hypothetical protein ACI97A_001333 [Planctomycetota bacterium]|jgi:hypothetical protein